MTSFLCSVGVVLSRYTSLGSTHNSFPNPCLLVKGGEAEGGIKKYRPAWELEDESKERAGR